MPKILGKYVNGNETVTIYSDGTKIRETEDDEFRPAYAENMDIKICNKCTNPETGGLTCAYCHEGSTPHGELADLNQKFIDTLHPYQEVALGGGNVLEHPGLHNFLERLKHQKIITNITLNQRHFENSISVVRELVKQRLIYGLGVSLVNPTEEFISLVKEFPNAVIHVINGIVTIKQLRKLQDNNLKVLILGYKELRRGCTFLDSYEDTVNLNKNMLEAFLPDIIKEGWFKVISFDNLAIEQLGVRKLLSQEDWDEFYAGDDGTVTYYIDMVKKQFAVSSTSPFEERYPILDNVDDMFKVIQDRRKNQ